MHIVKNAEMPFPEWCQSLTRRDDWVVLDTETTGLRGQVLELSIVSHDGSTLFDNLVRPTIPIESGAAAVHHITEGMLLDQKNLAEHWPVIEQILQGKLIITYGAVFDRDRIVQSCRANSISFNGGHIWMCCMDTYAKYYRAPDKYGRPGGWQKLEKACEQQEVERPEGQQHRALFDALWTWKLIMRGAQLGNEMNTFGNSSLQSI